MSTRVLGTALLMALLVTVQAPAQGGSKSSIATVDLLKVMLLHPNYKRAIEEAQREAVAQREQLRNRDDLRKAMVQDLDLLRNGSRKALNMVKKIKIHDETVELDYNMIQVEYQYAIVKSLKEVHALVIKGLTVFANKNGYSLVLNRTSQPVGGLTQYDYMGRLSMREVLFASADLDITEDLMKSMEIPIPPKDAPKDKSPNKSPNK